ncbi:DTW domain-containing protein 1 [Blyttiomyces sp. JEL0837]|nr:DTW domain-containing protein 1 [Blyttiomyces sp. JEL0837]
MTSSNSPTPTTTAQSAPQEPALAFSMPNKVIQRLHSEKKETVAVRWDSMTINPTEGLLDTNRILCEGCNKSYKTYCPHCCVALGHEGPHVKLPLPLDIYRHPNELEGKTTSVHTKIIAPEDTRLFVENFTRSVQPELLARYPNPKRVLLLFPSADSVTLDEIDRSEFDRLVVIDGTWKQARAMCWSLLPHGFRAVRIGSSPKTLFWRHQKYGDHCLATIEAIYWFYREFEAVFLKGLKVSAVEGAIAAAAVAGSASAKSDGDLGAANGGYVRDKSLDNLLFYFKLQYETIQRHYKLNPNITFTHKKIGAEHYIQYDQEEGNGEEDEDENAAVEEQE